MGRTGKAGVVIRMKKQRKAPGSSEIRLKAISTNQAVAILYTSEPNQLVSGEINYNLWPYE